MSKKPTGAGGECSRNLPAHDARFAPGLLHNNGTHQAAAKKSVHHSWGHGGTCRSRAVADAESYKAVTVRPSRLFYYPKVRDISTKRTCEAYAHTRSWRESRRWKVVEAEYGKGCYRRARARDQWTLIRTRLLEFIPLYRTLALAPEFTSLCRNSGKSY